MNDICRLLKSMKEKEDQLFAMATIIRVDGSAYRREGAKMLISRDGGYHGTISAGCLEQDLIYQAQEVMNTVEPKIVHYDLRSEDDLSWGQNAGCDGNIEVYIEPIGWKWNKMNTNRLLWPFINEQLNQGIRIISIKCLTPGENQGSILLYSDEGKLMAGSLGRGIEETLSPMVNQFLQTGSKVQYIHAFQHDFLFELYQPKEHLYVFGAGLDAKPLVELASKVDFSVTVVDPRSDRCNEEYFPHANAWIIEHPATFFNKRKVPKDSYVLVMTHNFNRDHEILQHLLANPPLYLGVLGPKRRTQRLVKDQALLNFIHSPIGLSIGAEGPEEISISVLAELIKIRNQSREKVNHPQIVENGI